ncbi:hypothetical protein V3C99_013862 [Haemonchus contortus]
MPELSRNMIVRKQRGSFHLSTSCSTDRFLLQ